MICAGGCGCGGSCAVSAPPDSSIVIPTFPTSPATIPPGCKCVCECLPGPATGGGPSGGWPPHEEEQRVLVPGSTGSGNVPDPSPPGGPRDDEALVAPLSPGGQGGSGSLWRPEPLIPGVRLGPGPATAPPRTTTDGGSGNTTMARRASPRERPLQRLDASMPFAASPWRPAGSGTMQDSVRGTATVDASQAVAVAVPLPSLDASDAPGVPAVAGRLSTLPPAGALVPRDMLRDGVNPVFRALAPISPLATGAARRAGAALGPLVSLRPEPFNDTDPDNLRRRRRAVATSADGSGALREPASARRPGTRVPDLVSIADTPSSAAYFVTGGVPEDSIPDVAHAQSTAPARALSTGSIAPGSATNATAALAPGADQFAIRPPLHDGPTAATVGQSEPMAPQGAATHIAIGVTARPPRAGVSPSEAGAAVRAPEGSGAAVGRGTGYDPAAAPRGPGPGLGDATGLGIPTLNPLRHGGKGGSLVAAAGAARAAEAAAWRAYNDAPPGPDPKGLKAYLSARDQAIAASAKAAQAFGSSQQAERRIEEEQRRQEKWSADAKERQRRVDDSRRNAEHANVARQAKSGARAVRDAATNAKAALTTLHGKGDQKLNKAAGKAADDAKKAAKAAADLAKNAERIAKYGSRLDAYLAAAKAASAADEARRKRDEADAALLAAFAAAGLRPPEMVLGNGVRLPLREGWDFGLPAKERKRVLELICGRLGICRNSCACTDDKQCECHWDYEMKEGSASGGGAFSGVGHNGFNSLNGGLGPILASPASWINPLGPGVAPGQQAPSESNAPQSSEPQVSPRSRKAMRAHVQKRLAEIRERLKARYGAHAVAREWRAIEERLRPILQREFIAKEALSEARVKAHDESGSDQVVNWNTPAGIEVASWEFSLAGLKIDLIKAIPLDARVRMDSRAQTGKYYDQEDALDIIELVRSAWHVDEINGIAPLTDESRNPLRSRVAKIANDPLTWVLTHSAADFDGSMAWSLDSLEPTDEAQVRQLLRVASNVLHEAKPRGFDFGDLIGDFVSDLVENPIAAVQVAGGVIRILGSGGRRLLAYRAARSAANDAAILAELEASPYATRLVAGQDFVEFGRIRIAGPLAKGTKNAANIAGEVRAQRAADLLGGHVSNELIKNEVGKTDIDVVLRNGDFASVGGPAKVKDLRGFRNELEVLKFEARKRGVRVFAVLDEGTPPQAIDVAAEAIGRENVRILPLSK